jgi:hypothetical protein
MGSPPVVTRPERHAEARRTSGLDVVTTVTVVLVHFMNDLFKK